MMSNVPLLHNFAYQRQSKSDVFKYIDCQILSMFKTLF